jgi:hypothetical protein
MLDRLFMGAAADDKLFVEDVFSTYLYTGNETARSISNGIDLAGKGGLVWIKTRTGPSNWSHCLADTARGPTLNLSTNNTGAAVTTSDRITSFNSDGFSIGNNGFVNQNGPMASWTFREAPKFFDVVTWTGTGVERNIAHNLGVAPGVIIIKKTSDSQNWTVYHRSTGSDYNLVLNSTAAAALNSGIFPRVTSTSFGIDYFNDYNAVGSSYVAYLFAHNAGGFGDAGTDDIISCGSYTETGSAVTVNLGWEPQWLMVKRSDSTGNWVITDNMRAFNMSTTNGAVLFANTSGAETNDPYWHPTATGFVADSYWGSGASVVYIAIRRGPMRTPTLGTSVFVPSTRTGTGTTTIVSSTTFPPDLLITRPYARNDQPTWFDRLRGRALSLTSNSTTADTTTTTTTNDLVSFNMNGITVGANQQQAVNTNGASIIDYNFRRAPGFFDEVCYTGINATRTVTHSLGVVPELIIVKNRTSGGSGWPVWSTPFSGTNDTMLLNTTAAKSGSGLFTTTPPTSTVFTVGVDSWINSSGNNFVAYLFASCPGVSKVGSYIGTGESDGSPASGQTINCGFSNGARFVLIKATNNSGDWYVFDTARGITNSASPWLSLNTASAESAGTGNQNYVEPHATGFSLAHDEGYINQCNYKDRQYIFLAIA